MKLPPHYHFQNPQLAQTALTHRSHGAPHNERMEWLGDAILQYESSRLLYAQHPELSEGGLSQLRARLVSGDSLARIARRLELGAAVRLGAASMHGGRDNSKLLAGLMEAYIAAVHLDGGDTRALIATLLADDIEALAEQVKKDGIRSLANAKSRLQEHLQRQKQPAPTYKLIKQQGRDDRPIFIVDCIVQSSSGDQHFRARGRTRAAAEQQAAADCLSQLTAAPNQLKQK